MPKDSMTRDRRRAARLVESVQFNLGSETFDLTSNTINLSTNGLLCRISRHVPVMTKLDMVILVPQASGKGRPRKVRAKGVVVRVEEDVEGLLKLAVFFTDISDSDKKHLHAFIQNKLEKKK